MEAYRYYVQHLQEVTALLSSAINMTNSSSSHYEQILVIIVSDGLPSELHHCPPEYFLVVDSGVTVHCLSDVTCTVHVKEQNSSIGGIDIDSRDVCISIGHL